MAPGRQTTQAVGRGASQRWHNNARPAQMLLAGQEIEGNSAHYAGCASCASKLAAKASIIEGDE